MFKKQLHCLAATLLSTSSVFAYYSLNTIKISKPNLHDPNLVHQQWIKEDQLLREEFNKKGYIEKENRIAHYLLIIGNNKSDYDNQYGPYDTHLRHKLHELNLAFKYIPYSANSFAFAPIDTYIKEKGWTGIKEYFVLKNIGRCSFSTSNFKVTNALVQLNSEGLAYFINNKPTNLWVKGTNSSGFVYTVTWFDNTGKRTLDCANMQYNEAILPRMIETAKNYDKKIM